MESGLIVCTLREEHTILDTQVLFDLLKNKHVANRKLKGG